MKASRIFDELVEELQRSFEKLPDPRSGENTRYGVKDAAVSAFGVFFTQAAAFLAYQRMMEQAKGRSNVQSLFGAERIPSDVQVRNLLDSQEPGELGVSLQRGMNCWVPAGRWKPFGVVPGSI